jgi:translation initiation factor 3 subunit B
LAAHTERYNAVRKTKEGGSKLTGVVSHLEIFDFTEKLVAVQTIQLPEPFIAFDWDPKGDRFCVLQGSSNKSTPLIYKIEKGKTTPQCISKLDAGMQLNTISWAPQGGWLVVYASGSTAGNVFFIDTNGTEATKSRGIEHSSINYVSPPNADS